MQSRHERLEQTHQQVEREVLAAVGMARELQIEPCFSRGERAAGLVGQQDFYIALRRAGERRNRI